MFRYFFTHGLANAPRNQALGAWHGIDLLFVFNHLTVAGYTPSAGEQALSDSIEAYWSSFAGSSAPSAPSSPAWAPSDAADTYLELATPPAPGAGVRTEQCDFWDTFAG